MHSRWEGSGGGEELHFIKDMRIFQSLFFSVERVINGDIQIPFILAIRSTCHLSRDRLISLRKVNPRRKVERYVNNNRFRNIKNSLLPMRILGMRPRTKPHGFMTSFKPNIKPRDESMHEIISRARQLEFGHEGEVADGAGVEVEV